MDADADPVSAPVVETAAPSATDNADADANQVVVLGGAAPEDDRTQVVVQPVDTTVGPKIHVLDGKTKKPVPGIVVHWIDAEDGRARRRKEEREHGLDPQIVPDLDLPLRYGKQSATDERGDLQLPPCKSWTIVAVRDEAQNRFAADWVGPERPEATLMLIADETLFVRVRDAAQKPQNKVPVGIYRGEKFGESESLFTGYTLADGIAAVPHFQILRDKQKGSRFAAAIAVPMQAPVAVEFAGKPAPKEPIDLVLPRTAEVHVRVVHQRGAPILAEVPISMVAVRPDKFTLPLPLSNRFDIARATKPLGDDVAVFPHLQLGIEITPYFRLPDMGPVALPALTLPQSDQSPLLLTLTLPPSLTVLTGTAARADGSAISDARIIGTLVPVRGGMETGSLTTLPDGRFDWIWRSRDPSQTWTPYFRMTDTDGTVLQARTAPQALPPGDRREIGILRFEPPEVLAFGDVRDDRGEPVAGAQVFAEWYGPSRRGPDEWLQSGEGLAKSVQSDADGTFRLLGIPQPKPMRIVAWKDTYQPFRSDSLGKGVQLHVVLVRNGVLKGRVILPEWLPKDAATLQLTSEFEPKRELTIRLPNRGEFKLEGITPDTYTARVTIRNLPKPVFELKQVRIDPGENRDPQLDPLDLAQSLHRFRLRAIGPGGMPIAGLDGPILWDGAGQAGGKAPTAFRWQNGKAELIAQVAFLEFTTVSQGYLPTKVAVAEGDHDVYLQPVQPVIVDVPGLRAACGIERAIRVSLIRVAESGLPQGIGGIDQSNGQNFSFPRWYLGKSGGGWLDNQDRAEAIVSMNGPHDVLLRVYADSRRDGPQVAIPLGRIDAVVDGQAPRTHLLNFDPQKLQAALRNLDQQLRDARANGSR